MLVVTPTRTLELRLGGIGERRYLELVAAALGAGTAGHVQFDPDYGWQQWDAPPEVLGDNVREIEA
jgi:hypothetical protein